MMDSNNASPIKSLNDVEKLRSILRDQPRDLLLFDLVTQTGSAARQILKLRFINFYNLKPGDKIVLDNGSSGNFKEIVINRRILNSFNRYATSREYDQDDYIFSSSYKSSHIALARVNKIVNSWYKKAGLKNVKGILSLRKTWEVHFRDASRHKAPISTEIDRAFQTVAQPQSLQETVLSEIERAILSGRLKPGKNIIADEIAKKMGISRMPVRQALSRLEARGFLKRFRGGVQVVQLSRNNLEEIIEVRMLLETTIAKIAVPILRETTVRKLHNIYKRYSKSVLDNDVDKMLERNRQFHGTIYKDANRPYLLQLIEDGWDRVSPYYHMLLRQMKEHERLVDVASHKGMLKSAEERDSKKFCYWLDKDISETAQILFTHL
ncbi:MAG: FCD domain-containing protein [Desulfobacterales bacterium]|nr:MAG: FCD domain-containing protein [Desulfobacterales bacterium]